MRIPVLILNYNGRRLLAECLPSVLQAAASSSHHCRVVVIDNSSTDDSVEWLSEHFPQVDVLSRRNRGLCSFNDIVPELDASIALLLNNDIKLDRACIDRLVAPLTSERPRDGLRWFMTTPQCRLFDETTYEGLKTAVRWRRGLVQATSLFPGHEAVIDRADQTASAGAVMAVDCDLFTMLGGFDPLYLPGRLEDLDFAYRAYQAGFRGRYVPEALAYHAGQATFGQVFGSDGCLRLALRNTLLFQWKNLRHPLHLARQLFGIPARIVLDLIRAPFTGPERRWMFCRALGEALGRLAELRATQYRTPGTLRTERAFFARFHPRRMTTARFSPLPDSVDGDPIAVDITRVTSAKEVLP